MEAALAAVIFAVTLLLIVLRPLRVNEAAVAVAGALAMVVAGAVSPYEAARAIADEWNLLLFFFGLMVTAAVADSARFFDWAAAVAAGASGGSGRRLLLNVLLLGALITTFLSNDAAAIILTPVVYTVVTRLRLRVTPYLFAVSFMANAASLTLPISNPTNVLTAATLRLGLGDYELHLLLASLASIAITAAVVMAIFWRAVGHDFGFDRESAMAAATADRAFFVPVVAGLCLLAAAYIAGAALLWPLGVVAVAGAAGLVAIAAARRRVSGEHLRAHVSPALFFYVAGLFVLIRGVEQAGITADFVAGATARVDSAWSAVISGLLGAAVLSNVVNNLPALLVLISGAQAGGVPSALQVPFLCGALAGADLGPNLTPVGALSTMLWLVIVRRRGVEVSAWDFLRIGAIVTPLTLIAAGLLMAASFR